MDPNALATLGLALGAVTLAEAAVAVVGIIAVAEAPAIASGIATSLAVGGFAGTVGAIALVGLVGIGVVGIVVGALALTAASRGILAAQLASVNTPSGKGQSGEQTDSSSAPPPPVVIQFSPILDDPNSPVIGTIGDSLGITQVTEPSVPSFSTSQFFEPTLLPEPALPDVPADPGLPGIPSDSNDVGFPGEVGLFSVAEPSMAGPLAEPVPWPSSLLILLLGILATARRIFR
jgi:hypothetical protein